MLEDSLTVPVWHKGCIEEIVILKETNEVLKYTFSNSLDSIRKAIYSITRRNINLEKAIWQLNSKLSISVKNLMTSYNVNYSMTTDITDKDKFTVITINMRANEKWFITSYFCGNNGKFVDWVQRDQINLLEKFNKFFWDYSANTWLKAIMITIHNHPMFNRLLKNRL
jgi:hypothetical protein